MVAIDSQYRVGGVLRYRDYAEQKSNGSTRREKVSVWQYNIRYFFIKSYMIIQPVKFTFYGFGLGTSFLKKKEFDPNRTLDVGIKPVA